MHDDAAAKRSLIYVPVPHLGFGWVQACVSISESYPSNLLSPTIVLPRAFRPVSASVTLKQAVPSWFPFRYASRIERPVLDYYFKRALAAADPRHTIVCFWPTPPISLVRYAREHGFLIVREMINTCKGTSKVILDEAYARLELRPEPSTRITDEDVSKECVELNLYDYILSPNPRIDDSLIIAGVNPHKILPTSFGWTPEKLQSSIEEPNRTGFRALFVGGDTVRKGVPQLLAAWKKSGVAGELVVVGDINASLRQMLSPYLQGHDVQLIKFESDLGRLYKSADVFIFPSLEEGDPQVTYEAAGCGLPIITTPMGSANIVEDGVNGIIVEPYDVDGLAAAIARLASSPEMRNKLGLQAAKDAQNYTYANVGIERAKILSSLLAIHAQR